MGSDFIRKDNGVIVHMMSMNKSIYQQTCICYRLDITIKRIFSWLDNIRDDEYSEDSESLIMK